MHGISSIIGLLLITLLLITLVSLLWLFTSGTINAIAKSGTNQTQRTQDVLSTCMIVDSIHENKVYIKNCGFGVIANGSLNAYMDDVPLNLIMTPQKVEKGGIGTVTILNDPAYFATGYHELKITNPNTQTAQAVEQDLPDSCVLDLEFDEGKGRSTNDRSGNGNNGILISINGTLYGDTSWVPGRFDGYGLQFDGSNDYVTIDSLPQLGPNPNNGPATVTLWFKTSVVPPSESKFLFSDSGGQEIGFVLLTSGKLQAQLYQGVNSLQPITANDWHFAALSYDYNNLKMYFYLDGQLQGSTVVSFGGVNAGFNDIPFTIGSLNGNTGSFNGVIDDVRVWNRSLSQSEIQAEMQSSSPVTNPIWSFEPSWMWANGKFGKALKFDGVKDYVSLPALLPSNNVFTVWLWFKTSSYGTLISEQNNQYPNVPVNYDPFLYVETNGKLHGGMYTADNGLSTLESSSTVNDNNWHYATLVVNGNVQSLYLDGSFVNSFNGNPEGPYNYLYLGTGYAEGSWPNTNGNWFFFNGTIDSVRIFNQALTPNQIDHVMLKMK